MDDYVLKLLGTGTVVATAAAWYMFKKPAAFNPNFDFSQQSRDAQGQEGAKITRLAEDGRTVDFIDEDIQTLHEAYKRGARISNNGQSLGWKPSATEPYQWISFNDVLTKASHVGSGFISLGLAAENSSHVGIYSQNRPEYFIAEQACYMYSMAIVPLYDTLGVEACSFIINQAELNLIVCDKNEKVSKLLSRFKETPNLQTLVVMETISEDSKKLAEQHNVKLLQFTELEAKGEKEPKDPKGKAMQPLYTRVREVFNEREETREDPPQTRKKRRKAVYEVGLKVRAKWGKKMYPAKIVAVTDKSVKVKFYDDKPKTFSMAKAASEIERI